MKFVLPRLTAAFDFAWAKLVRRVLEQLTAHPAASGRYVTDSTGARDLKLTNGAVNRLTHGLGRPLVGWDVHDLRGATATGRIVRVTSDGSATANDTTDLWFDVQGHGADITVRIWVQ